MKSKLVSEGPEKIYVLVFDTDDEFISLMEKFAEEKNITTAGFTAIGAFRDVTLGWFDLSAKDYKRIPIREQVEVISLIGDIAIKGNEPKIHAHVAVAKSDGTAHGGHILEAHIRPTLEVVLTETPKHLHRQIDEATGLALIRI